MVELDSKYVMDANENCYMLKMRVYGKDKEGNQKTDDAGNAVVSYSTVGYYTSVHDVFRAWYNELLRDKVRKKDLKSAADFVGEVRMAYKMVCKVIDKALPDIK